VLVKAQGQFHCIPATKIVWCESAGNYVQVHLGSDVVIVRSTLSALAAQLVRLRFERISRTTIVNLDCSGASADWERGVRRDATRWVVASGDAPLSGGIAGAVCRRLARLRFGVDPHTTRRCSDVLMMPIHTARHLHHIVYRLVAMSRARSVRVDSSQSAAP
jgi:hypothetical protein